MCQNAVLYENDGKYITEKGYANSSAKLFKRDTVLVALVGATIGKVALLKFETTTNQNVLGIWDIKENGYNPYYVYYYMQAIYGKFTAIGDGNFKMASKAFVSDLDILKPSLEKQDEFASFVEQADKLWFMEMFGEWNLSFQKENWIKLSDLTNIYTGTTPKTEIKEYWNGLIPWVTPAELDKDSYIITDTERHITEKGQKSKSLTMMPIGTVLLSTRAPIGKVAICGVPMTCNQGFKNFECLEKLHPTYLFYLFKLNNDWLQTQGTGTTFKEISKSKAGNIRIPVPTMSDQKGFAQFYNLVDKSRFNQGIQNA